MKRTALKKMGKDKARETAKYWPLRRKFIEGHTFCEFPDGSVGDVCCNHATQIHHMKGQHWKIMNDTKFWMGVCAEHHTYIEDHKKEMRKLGIILYK